MRGEEGLVEGCDGTEERLSAIDGIAVAIVAEEEVALGLCSGESDGGGGSAHALDKALIIDAGVS